jgi:hypothetical protein
MVLRYLLPLTVGNFKFMVKQVLVTFEMLQDSNEGASLCVGREIITV